MEISQAMGSSATAGTLAIRSLDSAARRARASIQYDGVGRRRGKTVTGTTTNFLYDGLNLVQELTSGGSPTANLVTGLGIDETFTAPTAAERAHC
jgi:hypothetical protein